MAARGSPERFDLQFGVIEFKPEGELNKGRDLFQGDRRSRGQEAVIADLHKASGQDMLEKAADKLHDIKGHGAPPVAVVLFVFEKDLSIFDLDDAGVGDSDFEDIGCKILQAVGRCAYGLRVDNPVLVPGILRDKKSEIGFNHLITELGLEDF